MKKFYLYTFNALFFVFVFIGLHAQVTLRLTSIPLNTPADAEIYFAGNIQGWNPGDAAWKLTKGGDGIFSITIPEGSGSVLYKFTLGSWDKVEKGPTGEEIANRTFTFSGNPQTLNLNVASWAGAPVSTAASNVQILSNSFSMPQLGRTRRIWLYLPPDYNTSSKHYPVIYMQDGQNLFDNASAFAGEWQVDETLNKLHGEGDYGAIVVGIDNGGAQRINEYSPWNNPQYGGGQGDAFIDFIRETLKPHIDANFRTLTQPQYTCIFGSSLGAFISVYGAAKFPNVFGKVGSFSPAYWFSLNNLNDFILNNPGNISGIRIIHQGGQNESQTMAPNIYSINNNMLSKGMLPANSKVQIDADGTHTEAYWRREFGAAYQWLFAGTILPVQWGYFRAATLTHCSGLLQWQTRTETRNSGFEIERSKDGISFEKTAFVPGAGNSAIPISYEYTVTLSAKEKVYYRLRQVDTDGQFSFSTVVGFQACRALGAAPFYPNPAKDFFFVGNNTIPDGGTVRLHAPDGKIIRTFASGGQQRFDLKGLGTSVYFVSVNGKMLGKLMKE
jgi:predicted alpha/beta superfamily hydrolase